MAHSSTDHLDALVAPELIRGGLPDIGGRHDKLPSDLYGATIAEIGTFADQSLVETGGLVIDYVPAGGNTQRRLVLAFNDVAMRIAAIV